MCGIYGQTGKAPFADTRALCSARDTMLHRGPDAAGEWLSSDRQVFLAHRRLSILDLSELANQPMSDASGQFVIVFNGEIYNYLDIRNELVELGYSFRSQSDTEVVLQSYRQWGRDCVSRFNGMFAFAIYDCSRQEIFLARDRAGEKPLYYSNHAGVFCFASELKAIMSRSDFTREIEPEALDCYLNFGYVPGELCILRHVSKLSPAHAMLYRRSDGLCRVWRYWSPPEAPLVSEQASAVDEQALLEEFEEILCDSVKRQLVADVPVGVLLSGGIDSSLVTAMAVRSSNRVKTFNVRFPGYGSHDETEHARLVAGHFATDHIELAAGDTTPELLPRLAAQYDEPINDSSMIPTFLVCQLVRQHCTVALGGDGGDELFGGYPGYSYFSHMDELMVHVPTTLRRIIGSISEKFLPVGLKGRNWFMSADIDFSSEVPKSLLLFEKSARERLLPGLHAGYAERLWRERTAFQTNLVERYTRTDFANYMAEDILVKVDRASMLNSIEMRAPFLDYRMIEFAYGKVPAFLKADARQKKIFLKKAARRLLPEKLDIQRKQGFSIPLQQWLRQPEWKNAIHDVLLASAGIFSRSEVKKLLRDSCSLINNAERLFALTLFELWRRHYGISLPNS
ncbi:MAG: asparagine synthase (glutamine-hydrolyzing) [Candidatus Riflebacteria bacterium HGW-Riflebacteria-2]|jgi:asparagine synthase (glutamine-hydrolysing)|nr:MAG: asparagine synthase (glutamine-hydrolyzing) [Candidatus Riflebacteria bacterium HGW-Riflebacteria-2]